DAGGGIARRSASRQDHVLERPVRELLEEGRPLEQAQLDPDAHRVEVVDHGLADARAREGLAAEISRLETASIARLREERARPRAWDGRGRGGAPSNIPGSGG